MLSPTTPTPSAILETSRIPPLESIHTSPLSLSFTRPAPPSPADSRRTSTLSARSTGSKPSTPGSGNNSRRESRSSFGHGLGFTSSTGTGTGSKRQSTLSSLSTMSGNTPLSPQQEGEENSLNSPMVVDSLTTPTAATPTSVAVFTATPDISQPSPITETTPTSPGPNMKDNQNYRRSTRVKIKIRDFAYRKPDDRYRGMGTDVPKPNRFARLNKKLGGSKKIKPSSRRWSVASDYVEGGDLEKGGSKPGRHGDEGDEDDDEDDNDEEDDDDDDDDDDSDGWFRRGMGRFSWSFGLANLRRQIQLEQEEEERQKREKEQQLQQQQQQQQQQQANYPSRGEMDLNFGSAEDNGESSGTSSTDVYYDTREHQHEVVEEHDGLRPGTYRAVFAFDPEGPTEMRLYEDQLVNVVGRGGEGWAVVLVPNEVDDDKDSVGGGSMQRCGVEIAPGVRHALVPESYLEATELD